MLIHCPVCGKEVSEEAATCPNCGHTINERTAARQNNSSYAGCGTVIAVIIGLMIFYALG